MIRSNAPEFRRMAEDCLSIARKMSLKSDRIRMEEMAQRWLDLASQAETTGFTPVASSPLIAQPMAAQQSKLSDDEQS